MKDVQSLVEAFNTLETKQQLEFFQEVMPTICSVICEQGDPKEMMKEFMPMCMEMMKGKQGMDMKDMMGMMNMMEMMKKGQ